MPNTSSSSSIAGSEQSPIRAYRRACRRVGVHVRMQAMCACWPCVHTGLACMSAWRGASTLSVKVLNWQYSGLNWHHRDQDYQGDPSRMSAPHTPQVDADLKAALQPVTVVALPWFFVHSTVLHVPVYSHRWMLT